jgi:hypothetical protein
MNGMVGTTMTRIPTTISSITEYFVAADTNPNGYVYIGGTADLYRAPKAGGTTENLETLAGVTSTQEGYEMLIDGDQIFTLEASTTATSNLLWRLSSDGGTTWTQQNYMQLPQVPNDDMKAIAAYNGRYYMATEESTAGTEIWSVAAASTALPETAVLELMLPDEKYCNAMAVDDDYFYLACYTGDRVVRVDRVTHATELITDAFDFNITKNSLHADDIDGDGHADVLYLSSYYGEVDYVCDPHASGPFYTGILTSIGAPSTNYGLGIDRVNKVLWLFDDDTKELVKVE